MLKKPWILTAILTGVYVAARIWRLTDSCLWFDEIFSVHAAEHSWDAIWWFVAQDLIHPPLFYVVLKLWISAGGESVLWLRLLPVLFSVFAVIPFIYLCRELKLPPAVKMIALAMLALNGSLIKYTQTVRMYSMLMFLAVLSTWLFARYFYRGKSFVPLVIVNLLLVYTHYFGWLVIGAEVLTILLFQRIKWRRALVMSAILIAGFVPWIIAIWRAAAAGSQVGQNIGWMSRPGGPEMLTFLFDLTEPVYFQASNVDPASIYHISIPILFIFISAIAAYFVKQKPEEDRQRVYVLSIFALFPSAVAFAASWMLAHSVWGTRHLIVIYVPMTILLAYFLIRIRIAWLRIGAVSLLLLFSIYAVVLQSQRGVTEHVWCAWNDAADDITSQRDDISKIYTFENLVAYHLWFALRESSSYQISTVKGLDVRTDDKTYFLPRGFGEVPSVQISDIRDEDFWLAFRTSTAGEGTPIVTEFTKLGYKECPRATRNYYSTSVFWMRMTKRSDGCE